MNTNTVPHTHEGVTTLAVKTLAGAQTFGVEIELEHNTAVEIAADLYDHIGDPATPLVPGKQAKLNAAKEARTTARQNVNIARIAGQDYCRLAIGLLKPVLGTSYNSAWEAAGFLKPSLAVPEFPMAMLMQFRQYFNAHAAHENAPANITGARAQTLIVNLQTADLAVASADSAYLFAKSQRDTSFKTLRKRMMGTRKELEELLEDNDGRWYEFGFNRPADGTMPSLVPDLVLTPGGASIVLVRWGLASLAENYRVTWRVTGSAAEPTEVGLFADRQCSITGLPSGVNIVVGVSARNDSGETAPTEVAITVG